MSEEIVNPDRINPALSELESELAGLLPTRTVNRDELLFEAGRRAALPRRRNETRLWKSLAAALAVMLAGQTFLFWPSVDESRDAPIARRSGHEEPVNDLGTDGVSEIVPVFPEEPPAHSTADRSDGASRDGAQYLRLRRLALTEGVDAVDLLPSEKEQSPAESGETRREILRELLGS
jgi:hypothetical protein